jgi:putative oxygen-independent coproporphyrinogen III oxidase
MLSLYIHIPFCVKKCLYCGYYSTRYTQTSADAFITALRREAAGYHNEYGELAFQSVYIGGGTPTVFSHGQIRRLGDIISDLFSVSESAEFTVEANPNTVSERNLEAWREIGANRLSLGVQSFSDDVLGILGRLHTAGQAMSAFRLARNSGFGTVGMDLIYGVPGQTMLQWKATLEAAIHCRPDHLSAYSLSIDDGSLFRQELEAGRFPAPDEDMAADMYECTAAMLARAGYRRYEISNFALPGSECKHNLNYWGRGEYLGLGPAAWSFVRGRRYHNIADSGEYAKRMGAGISALAGSEVPGQEQASRETLLLSLRTMKGLDLDSFRKEYGSVMSQSLEAAMAPLQSAGLILVHDGWATLSERGILLSNEALSRLSA